MQDDQKMAEVWVPRVPPIPLSEGRRSWLLANGFEPVRIPLNALDGSNYARTEREKQICLKRFGPEGLCACIERS
jgi:hypothetical protein